MTPELAAYYLGIFIVFFTHIVMLAGGSETASKMCSHKTHAIVNLFAASLIAFYFVKTQVKA